MNLFTRRVHTVLMCNVMVPFVCTGFLGMKTTNGIIVGSTTDEAHEISLTASDTEPVSQYGKGEENQFSLIGKTIETLFSQPDVIGPYLLEGDENDFAFITDGVSAIISQRESVLQENKKVEKKNTTKNTKNTTKKATTKTTTVVSKKEVATSTTYEKPSNSNATGEAIANYAKKFKGLRYSSGKQSLSSGADCSGFTMLVYREFGVSLPRTVSGQRGKGKEVSKSNLQKGDLVFFKPKGCKSCGASHVAIYIGGGQVVHETRPGRGVAITGIDGLSNIQYVGARRIINSATAKTTEPAKETKTDTTINVTPTPVITPTIEPTPTITPTINDEEKNENVNNNVADVVTATATPTITATPLETKQEVIADTLKEEKAEEVKESTSEEGSN